MELHTSTPPTVLRRPGAGALIPMMNLQQYVQYMKDGGRGERPGHEHREDLHRRSSSARSRRSISTDWQTGGAARRGAAAQRPGRPHAARGDTRYSPQRQLVRSGGADPRAGVHARGRRSPRSTTRRIVCASVSRRTRRASHGQGEGGGVRLRAGDDAVGQPTTTRILIRPGCSIRDPTTIRSTSTRCSRAQSVVRQQVVNRVFGSAYAELTVDERADVSNELRARLHAAQRTAASTVPGPTAPARTSARTARTRGSHRRPASSISRISRTRSTTSCSSTGARQRAPVRRHGAVQHPARSGHRRIRSMRRTSRTDAALV